MSMVEHVLQDDRSLVCQILKEASKGRAVDMNTLPLREKGDKKNMGDKIDGWIMIADQFGINAYVTLMPIKHSLLNQIERVGLIRRK